MHIYEHPQHAGSSWVSFENRTGGRGSAALENGGAKGHAFERLQARETKTLLDVAGSGTVCRIWMTVSDRSPEMLRSLRLEMYWDGCSVPAVSCPLGDFFGIGLGRRCAFECQLFSDPEGRSFNCFVPMPFRTAARITLTNDSDKPLSHLFYDINLLTDVAHSDSMLYFHAHWRRERPNKLGVEYDMLPAVSGAGRFLGCNIGVMRNPAYEDTWWGEGEVKVWFGADKHPTLCGTGTEDYIGTAWGQGSFSQRTQGCPIADSAGGQWAFYRYHIDDPIHFDDACRVAIQTIGGAGKEKVMELLAKGAELIPVSIDPSDRSAALVRLMDRDQPVDLQDPGIPAGWCNFWRQDDWSSTAYFYLDSPSSALPELASLEARVRELVQPDSGQI
jgi:hypothetical protein